MHPRKAIREAFRARFAAPVGGAFLTSAADRVHKSRLAPIQDSEDLPAIIIYAREEKIDPERGYGADGRNSHTTRTLDLVVSGIVRANEDVDDKLDDMAAEIEAAIDGWEIPGHETARVRLIETDIDLVVEGVKKPLGEIGLTYRITYRAPWRPEESDHDDAWIMSP